MRALDDLEQDSPPFTPAALTAFEARGFARVPLAEAKAALVGVRLRCATVDAKGENPFGADTYEVANVTRDAIILVYRRQDCTCSARFSIQIATGRSKRETFPGYSTALHPRQADLLRGLLGVALPTPKAPK